MKRATPILLPWVDKRIKNVLTVLWIPNKNSIRKSTNSEFFWICFTKSWQSRKNFQNDFTSRWFHTPCSPKWTPFNFTDLRKLRHLFDWVSRGRHPLVSWEGFENHWIPRGVSCGPWTEPNQCLALCSIHTCCVCRNVCFVLLLFCLPFGVYVCLQIHCGSAFAQGPLQNTLLLRATRMRPQLFGRASGVASLVTNKQTNKWDLWELVSSKLQAYLQTA